MANEGLLPNVTHSFAFAKGDLPKLRPFQFKLEENLSRPYELHIRLVPDEPSIDESTLVGEACTLTVMRGGPGALVRQISGLVARATFNAVPLDLITPEGNLPTGVVDLLVVPAVWALSQRRNNRIFQNKNAPAVLKEVLEAALLDYGRMVTFKTTDSKYQNLEYCTQYDETDLEFVERLMATEGIMSYFKQGEKDEELVLFDDSSNYQELMTLDHNKVSFESNQKGISPAETVSAFEVGTSMRPTSATVRVFNWSAGSGPDETPERSQDPQGRDRELYYGEAPVSLKDLSDDGSLYKKTNAAFQVKLIQETELAQKCLVRGEGVVTGLTPGMTFELDNALRSELNQKYLVVGAIHTGLRPDQDSMGSFAGDEREVRYSNVFHCVPVDVLFRLPRPPRRTVQTLQTALVVGYEDVTTDTHGRIKVQFHWDRKGKNDIRSSCWIRVAQFSAGMGFGAVFIPRRGQEVVVAFLEGDPDKPLVIGSVYNGAHLTPYDLTGRGSHPRDSKTRSVIRTRSTPDSDGYNEISFEDAKGAEELYIQAQKNMNELVKNDHELVVANDEVLKVGDDSKGGKTAAGNRTRSVKNDETIGVGGNRTKTVEKDEKLNVNGNRTRHVKVDETVNVDGNRTQTVKLDETLNVNGNRTRTVKLDETMTVHGNQTLTVDKDRTATVKTNDALTIEGTHDMTVTKEVTETFNDGHTCSVAKHQELSAKSKTETIKEAYDLTTSKKFQLTQGGSVLEFEGDKVSLKAGNSVKIFHEKGVVEIMSSGDVNITGAQNINFKAGGTKLTLKSSDAALKSGTINIG